MKLTQLAACALAFTLAPSLALGVPLLRYSFDEASGDALDSGTAPLTDGVLLGGAVRSSDTPGGFGSSIDFRTETPYAHVLGTDADELDGLSAITVATWLKVESYPSGNHRLASKQNAGTFGGFNFSMNATLINPSDDPIGADQFRVGMFIGNNVSPGGSDFAFILSDAYVDAADKWVFLAVTYDNSAASGNTKFYIGGVASPVTPLGSDQTLPQLTIEGGPARFGVGFTDAAPTSNTSVIGLQDDVRVYGSALDLAALEAVRLEGLVPEPSSLALVTLAVVGMRMRRRR